MISSDDNDKLTPPNHDNDPVALEVRNLSKFWESQAGRVIGIANITFNVKRQRRLLVHPVERPL
jgi:hypothetical protein